MTDGTLTAYAAPRMFDGERWHENAALVVADGKVQSIGPVPDDIGAVDLAGGLTVPGFIDLQVNGGGGALVGPGTNAEQLAAICAVHAGFGTTALLPTLITDTEAVTDAVLAAGAAVAQRGVPGFLGLHLEGPHLSVARKGAHDPALIRPMTDADLVRLERARQLLPHLLVTVAAETVLPEQIARLVRAGIVVSIGHSDAGFEAASAAFRAGATMATHLFNAMSQIGNRDPGVAGAALRHGAASAGLIADGIHVHRETIRIALAAKSAPGHVFLVSDSMSQAGTALESFSLNGRTIYRRDGALRLEDGTLAGADLTLDAAVRFVHRELGLDLGESLRMATAYPAAALGDPSLGRLRRGGRASFLHVGEDLSIQQVWIDGRPVPSTGRQG